jgi:hypothetical protein
VTVTANQISDTDPNDPPDQMASDYSFSFTTSNPPATNIIINEVDSDTPGNDAAEFVELYDGGVGNTSLNGLVVVFYNGNGDVSYAAFDLDGFSTDANGYFTIGNPGVPGVDLTFNPGGTGFLQNGEDAVALYAANGSDFPNGTSVTTTNLQDAIVYDTGDPDDPGLLVLLNAGQPQVDENGGGNGAAHSVSAVPTVRAADATRLPTCRTFRLPMVQATVRCHADTNSDTTPRHTDPPQRLLWGRCRHQPGVRRGRQHRRYLKNDFIEIMNHGSAPIN